MKNFKSKKIFRKKYFILILFFVLIGTAGYLFAGYNQRIPLECKTRGEWIGMRKECDFGSFPLSEKNDNKFWCEINLGYYAVERAEPDCACIPSAKCIFKLWKYEN